MSGRRVIAMLALTLAAGVQAATPIAQLPLIPYRKGVAARIEVGGKPRLFQLDTAAGLTVIAPKLAREIGCAPWGAVVGFHMTGTKISAPRCDAVAMRWGGQRLLARVTAVTDVGSPDTPIDGLLALDVFAGRAISIDFAGAMLTVESPESLAERTVGATAVPGHIAREIGGIALSVFVEVPSAKGPLRMELDSGNGGTILVSRPMLGLLGLDTGPAEARRGAFAVAPGVTASGLIFSPDLVIDGNLGMPFLKDWVVTLDLANGRVWLKHTTATPPVGMGVPPILPEG